MTEREVYKLFGWPEQGEGFILPVSDSDEDCTPYRCVCGWIGVFYGAYREETCVRCGEKLTLIGEKLCQS